MSNPSFIKQAIAFSLMVSVFGSSLVNAAPATSPELDLLVASATLAGKKMSNRQFSVKMAKIVSDYDQKAPSEGREQRLTAALIETGMMTPDRAEAFHTTLKNSVVAEIARDKDATMDTVVASSLANALSKSEGAQFSECAWSVTGSIVFAAGLAGSIIAYNNATKDDYSYSYYEDGRRVTVEKVTDAPLPTLGIVFSSMGLVLSLFGMGMTC